MNCLITVREKKHFILCILYILIGVVYTNRKPYKIMSFVKNIEWKNKKNPRQYSLKKTV